MNEEDIDPSKRERHKIPITVQLLMINEADEVLLTRRLNTGYEDGKYCLPGGHVEENEEIKSAMIREAKEEIGVDINENDLEVYKVINRRVNKGEYIDFILKPKNWKGEIQIKEKDKCDDIMWANINKIPQNTLPFIQEVLKNDKAFYIPYNWEES